MKSKNSAAGQYLGYGLQPVRLFYHLLTASADAYASIEHSDDVAVHNADGTVLLEQTKSAQAQNPVSDGAKDLWKTFANWIEQIKNGADPDRTLFQLYVTPVKTGSLVNRMHRANDDALVDKIIAEIEKQPPSKSDKLKALLKAPVTVQRSLIKNFKLVSEEDPLDQIKAILDPTVGAALMEVVCDYGMGLAKTKTDALLKKQEPAIIGVEDFRHEFRAFVSKVSMNLFIASLTSAPSLDEIKGVIGQAPRFVRQLGIIDADENMTLKAVSDYLRTSADKTKWADLGIVVKESVDACDDDLIRQYGFINTELTETQSELKPASRGRLLYSRCGQVTAQLDGREVPGHYVPGSFNSLADVMKVGWHPDYEKLLSDG